MIFFQIQTKISVSMKEFGYQIFGKWYPAYFYCVGQGTKARPTDQGTALSSESQTYLAAYKRTGYRSQALCLRMWIEIWACLVSLIKKKYIDCENEAKQGV